MKMNEIYFISIAGLSGRDKHKFMVMAYKYENKSEEDI